MVVEFGGRGTYSRAGVVGEEHDTSGFWKACREKVFEPKLASLCPGFPRVISFALKVETVNCYDAGRMSVSM